MPDKLLLDLEEDDNLYLNSKEAIMHGKIYILVEGKVSSVTH